MTAVLLGLTKLCVPAAITEIHAVCNTNMNTAGDLTTSNLPETAFFESCIH